MAVPIGNAPARTLILNEYDDRLTRVGRSFDHYEWSNRTATDFEAWWHLTPWYTKEMDLPEKARRIPVWGRERNASGWQYFNEAAERLTGKPKLICQRCDSDITHPKKNGTTALSTHPMSTKCLKISAVRGHAQPNIQEGFKEGMRRQKNELADSGPLGIERANFEAQLIRCIISNKWSISCVDNIEVIRTFRCLDSNAKTPSSTTVTRRILDKRKDVEANLIPKRLPPDPQQLSIVLDCWSAPRREGYIAIKAYWVSHDWQMQEALIGFEPVNGGHTGKALAEIVMQRLKLFKVEKRIIAVTSDNASNNKTLAKALNEAIPRLATDLGIEHDIALCPCLSHVIQLAANKLLVDIKIKPKNEDLKKNWVEDEEKREMAMARGDIPGGRSRGLPYTVAKARLIAVFINSSEGRWGKFRMLQEKWWEEFGHSTDQTRLYVLRCFQDVKTRWDSTNNMLLRLRILKSSVDPFTKEHAKHLQLSDDEWGQVDYIIAILRPFAIYTQLIGASRLPTIHQVYDIYNNLLSHIEQAQKKLGKKAKHWKKEIHTALESGHRKLKDYYIATSTSRAGTLYGVSILLDPRKKSLTWQGPDWKGTDYNWEAHYWREFEEMYVQQYADRTLASRRRVVPPGMQPKNHINLDSVMDGLYSARNQPENRRAPQTPMSDAMAELEDYKRWNEAPFELKGPFDHWPLIQDRFPRIAIMARDVFSIQAAGVGVEREFSIAGAFNVDSKTYSDAVLGALMVCNHAQNEENRADRYDYYSIHCRVETVENDELEGERDDHQKQLNSLVQTLGQVDISDTEEVDEDGFMEIEADDDDDDDDLYSYPTPRIGGPRIGLPNLPSFTSSKASSVRGNDDDDDNEMEVDDTVHTPSRITLSRAPGSRTALETTNTSLLSSPMARLSAIASQATDLDVISPSTSVAGRVVIASGGGRRTSSRLSLRRPSARISAADAALVNGRPAQKRLRASTILSE